MHVFRTIFFITLIAAPFSQAFAVNFVSGDRAPVVIELFTSEGCSSCPPAERWLNGFTRQGGLWDQYFPIAWHVDYWDELGWPDPFANPKHSARQWRYKRQTPLRSVYTPGVLVGGEAWRGWVRGRPPAVSDAPVPGVLAVEINGREFAARFEGAQGGGNEAGLVLNAALLGFGLQSRVTRGENSGKTLAHDFVVLASQAVTSAQHQWRGSLPGAPAIAGDASRLAIVFWLERPGSPQPLVITGGWLPDNWPVVELAP